ncbi:c-type cytochrome [Altererythrobacter aurantiacus]|uniref:C-type cytochrome n=1 Tax=Parapontixanthobacter aurantiacus TaxID=1463599 RepID=A0A844ZFB3_9SPHN|nr:c-type cytochrome [Parapontixanthobacter aurantiacus]
MRKPSAIFASLILATALSACSEAEPSTGRYEITGEVIALSGGDAGARGACVTCHGLNGQGNGNHVPRIAGLDPGYHLRQLEYFAEGQRRHPQMTWIADHLDWPAREKVANYYASLPVPDDAASEPSTENCGAAELYQSGDPSRGLPSCASCHGRDGAGIGQGNPPLAAQPAPYLEAQLKAWDAGERYGDPNNTMTRISQLLTEQEMARLAGYSSALPGASGYPAPPASCPRTRRLDPRSGA